MTYPFFNRVLKQLNRKLNYDAAVGYAGNSFFKESSKLINESNPMFEQKRKAGQSMIDQLVAAANVKYAGMATVGG